MTQYIELGRALETKNSAMGTGTISKKNSRKIYNLLLIFAFLFVSLSGCSPQTMVSINSAELKNVGVWPITSPVAGIFPTSLYFYRFRSGTAQANIVGGGGDVPGEPGSNANNFSQTITWYPIVDGVFLPNTIYTATLRLRPVSATRTFSEIPLEIAKTLPGLPTDGVTAISAEHEDRDLLIHITFAATGELQPANRIMYEDFALTYGSDLGRYFFHGPNDNNRHGLSTWRDDVTYVRTSETPNVGNELVIGFRKDPTLAPADVSQAYRDNWIRSGVATTRTRNGTGRGNATTFEHTFGFYEANIQFDAIRGMWGAFWLMGFQVSFFGDHPDSHGAIGTEIDIVETFYSWMEAARGPHAFNNAWHWNGYGEHHRTISMSHNYWTTGANVYDGNFHVFGLEWGPSYYVFFLNGVEIGRHADGAETSRRISRIAQNPNYIKFSIEAAYWAGGEGIDSPRIDAEYGEFRVDFVSVWDGPRPNIISYVANGGYGEMADSFVIRGFDYVLAENGFTRPGYRFVGWNTRSDGSGVTYREGDVITTSTDIVDIRLYAQWIY